MIELKINIEFEQIFNLANQLPQSEKQKLIDALQKTVKYDASQNGERELGKYKDKIWMSDDFNAPLDDFKEYM